MMMIITPSLEERYISFWRTTVFEQKLHLILTHPFHLQEPELPLCELPTSTSWTLPFSLLHSAFSSLDCLVLQSFFQFIILFLKWLMFSLEFRGPFIYLKNSNTSYKPKQRSYRTLRTEMVLYCNVAKRIWGCTTLRHKTFPVQCKKNYEIGSSLKAVKH